jgi:phosphoglucosamine mutase
MTALRWFGTDGIRGIAFEGVFTAEKLTCLGSAFGKYMRSECHKTAGAPWALLGIDTRASGSAFAQALAQGLSQEDIGIGYLGVCSSPALAWLCRHHQADFGIMVSASHNPAQYNGIKFFLKSGSKPSLHTEGIIESYIEQALTHPYVPHETVPYALCITHDQAAYEHALTQEKCLKELTVVLDAAQGSVWQQAAHCFEACGAKVVSVLGNAPDGNNINEGCGVLHPEALQKEVLRCSADLGFCFDGDGDRIGVVDSQGRYWNGDHILAALAEESQGIVGTRMSNYGLERKCQERKQSFFRVDVGDRWVSQALKQYQLRWGGEPSGHVIDYDFLPVGDGLWIALSLAHQYIAQKKQDFFPAFTVYPGIQANLCASDVSFLDFPEFHAYMNDFHKTFGSGIRIVVRPSGTEPVLRVLLEGEDARTLEHAMQVLLEHLRMYIEDTVEQNQTLAYAK